MKKYRELILVILFFAVLSLIYTYPLMQNFSRGMPYAQVPASGYETVPIIQGDHLQFYYYLWLGKEALLGRTALFRNPYEFSARERSAPFTTQLFPLSLLFLMLSIGGNFFAYNGVIILCITFSGITGYYLVKLYAGEKLPAILGGVIIALAPFRIGQLLGGHLNGFIIFLLPLTIYFYELAFEKRMVRYGVLAGICLLLFAIVGEHHLTYYVFLFTAIYLPLKLIFIRKRESTLAPLIAIIVFMFISVVFLLFLKTVLFGGSIASGGRELSEVRLFSPSPQDLFRRTNEIEKLIYPGIIPFLLTVFGIVTGTFMRRRFPLWQTLFYTVVFVVSLLLALGPSSPLYRFAYTYVPYFNLPRSSGRIISMTFLAMSILSAQGLVGIMEILRKFCGVSAKFCGVLKYRNIVSYLLLAGVLFDYHPHCRIGLSFPERENKVYDIIRENIGDRKLLELPIWPGDTSWSSIYQYYVTLSKAKMINGYSPAVSRDYVKNTFLPLYPLDFGEMREEQYRLLRELDVKYVVGHAEAFPVKVSPFPFSFTLNNLKSSPYLELLEEVGPISLFELEDAPVLEKQEFRQSSIIGHIYEAERLKRRTGNRRLDADASGGWAVVAEAARDREGHIAFGPYRTFPSGEYIAIFRLKVKKGNGNETAAILDVCTDKGKKILAERRLVDGGETYENVYQDFALPFSVAGPSPLEFRIYYTGKAALRIDYVYVTFADRHDPELSIEAEEMFHIARRVEEKSASKGAAVFADCRTAPADYLISGPYRRYPAGEYEAVFRLKVGKRIPQPVASIAVTKGYSRRIIAERTISGLDFSNSGTYEEFRLPFTITKPEVLEFLVGFKKNTDIWIDSIFIKNRGHNT